jgi:Secretion system C-terminal sorting domain
MKKIILLTLLCYIFNLSLAQAQEYLKVQEVYDFAVGELTYNLTKLIFYSKNGQKWGERSSVFELCKPLTVKEVYDFNVGDIFIYKSDFFDVSKRRVDTFYERKTVLNKRINLPDSIVYFIKNESAYVSNLSTITVKIDTLVVKDLDSFALYKVKSNNALVTVKDKCETLRNSDRDINGRELAGRIDYCQHLFVGRGIGDVRSLTCGIFSDYGTNLIYFKKGTETWGSFINFLLTVREVYDFAVKDTFVYRINLVEKGRKNFILHQSVLKKWYNTRQDSLFYQVKNEYLVSANNKIAQFDTLIYTFLDSSVLKYTYPDRRVTHPRTSIQDSIYLNSENYNGRKTTSRVYNNPLLGGIGRIFTKGLGSVYAFKSIEAVGTEDTTLLYFSKNGEVWGKWYDLSVAVTTPSVFLSKIHLSPNPVNDILTLKSDETFDKIHIINSQGVIVASESGFIAAEKTISLAHLPNGIYFTQVFKGKIRRGVTKFVLNN